MPVVCSVYKVLKFEPQEPLLLFHVGKILAVLSPKQDNSSPLATAFPYDLFQARTSVFLWLENLRIISVIHQHKI